MLNLKNYHRPTSVREALMLLSQIEGRAFILAGGTTLPNNTEEGIDEVIDLQSTGLEVIEVNRATITIGAMTRLQALVDHSELPALIRDTARLEGPNTLRNSATIGGIIVQADWESELYAALLIHDASITLEKIDEKWTISLGEFDSTHLDGAIITEVSIAKSGVTAHERISRTPIDKPIIAVLGRAIDGVIKMAVCGVAERPILVNEDQLAKMVPLEDFRGSREYRLKMARLLSNRVLAKIS